MNEHEKRLFDFLTTTENFNYACVVMDNFQMVKLGLHRKFWDACVAELQLKLGDGWLVEFNDAAQTDWNWAFYVFKPHWRIAGKGEWPVVAISWQQLHKHPFYGPWVNNRAVGINHAQIHQTLRSHKAISPLKDENPWWPCTQTFGYDFDQRGTLKQILPETQSDLIKAVVANTKTWINSLESTLDEIAKDGFSQYRLE